MTIWLNYTEGKTQHSVVGMLKMTPKVYSPQLDNHRQIYVWLPPSYDEGTRSYPVIYMHDGDNLFDAHISYSGEWCVDETLTALSTEGLEAIVVGIPNMGERRFFEYNPYPQPIYGQGDLYVQFLADTLKPIIDVDFRTLSDPAHTGIAGSSMGGLISLYGFLTRPDIFGLCGSFSPVFWLDNGALFKTLVHHADGHGRVYLDTGTKEGEVYARLSVNTPATDAEADHAYRDGVRRLYAELQQQGYTENIRYVEDEGGLHNEAAWAKRLPDALRFLLRN